MLDKLALKLGARILENLPRDMSPEQTQGWINNPKKLAEFLAGLNPSADTKQPTIDCDADPVVPDGWKVEMHQKGGEVIWDPTAFELWLSPNQLDSKRIEGHKLRKELADQSTLNANVLDYLLANPHLIPEEWKGKAVFFWGTIYRDPDGDSYVRCLYWRDDRWGWSAGWLSGDWAAVRPALVVRK